MCRDVLASRELLGVAHGMPWYYTHPQNTVDQEKGQEYAHNTLADTPTIPHPQNKMATCYYVPIEDQRLKQAYCDSDRSQVSPFGVL